jgi:hypothetical protein
MNRIMVKDPFKYNPNVADYPEELRKSIADRWKFFSYPKLLYLFEVYKDLYGMTQHQFDAVVMTYKYYSFNKLEYQNNYGNAALYDGDNFYELNDRSASMNNQKRIYSTNHGLLQQTVGWW